MNRVFNSFLARMIGVFSVPALAVALRQDHSSNQLAYANLRIPVLMTLPWRI